MLLAVRIVVALIVAGAPALAADGPPAPPTTQQVQERTAQIQQWFNQLNDTNAEVRENARYELLGLARSELTILKSVVKAAKNVAPAQSSVLHDIVIHVYLAAEPRLEGSTGFLGLSWSAIDNFRTDGPPIRMIGCVAYRAFQEGDEIVGLRERRLFGEINARLLTDAIRSFAPGDTIHMLILRRGQLKEIVVRLDAQPTEISVPDVNSPQRLQPAEDVWTAEFVPLLQERTM